MSLIHVGHLCNELKQGDVASVGTLNAVALIIHGTSNVPVHLKKERRYADEEFVASALDGAEVRLCDENHKRNAIFFVGV